MKTYFNEEGQHQADFDRMWDAYVPAQGEADTAHGEAIRIIARFSYDIYNNGGGGLFENDEDYTWNPYYSAMADNLTEFMIGSGLDIRREIRHVVTVGIDRHGWDEVVSRFEPLMDAVIRRALHEEEVSLSKKEHHA